MKIMDNNRCDRSDRYVLSGGCSTRTREEARVTVPVAVRAFAVPGDVDIRCHGPAVVTRNSNVCPGVPCGSTIFTISQRIRLNIPIDFKAEAEVGESRVIFGGNDDDPDCNCGCGGSGPQPRC